MSKGFFSEIKAMPEYSAMLEANYYHDLPGDWTLVLTDVKNSTKAIDAGRYKAVNAIGVSCIVAVQNALAGQHFPFIFGGDGATLAIPSIELETVKRALCHTRAVAEKDF